MTKQTVGTTALKPKREIIHLEATQSAILKLRVAGYARVSSDSDDQLNSFSTQVSHYHKIITQNPDWELVDIYADEGITGVSTEKRDDFNRMLHDCRDGKIDRIITKSTSRFSRNTLDSLGTIRELKSMGISVYFEKEGIDTAKITGENLLTLHSLFAQEESISISQNCKKGNRMRMAQGTYVPSNAPYGYRLIGGELEIWEEEATVVCNIFQSYLAGSGVREIQKELKRKGVKGKFGSCAWAKNTITGILRNEKYAGNMLLQKTYTEDTLPYRKQVNHGALPKYYVEHTHTPIISSLQYELATLLLAQRASEVELEYEEHLLTGKIRCKHCGTVFRRKVPRDKVYWGCRQHDENRESCPTPLIAESKIYQAFLRLYNKLKANSNEILCAMLNDLQHISEAEQRGNSELQNINKRIADLMKQNHRMSGLLSSGILDSAIFISKTDELKKRLEQEKQNKSRLLRNLHKDATLEETENLLEVLQDAPDYLTQINEELFEVLIEKILVQGTESIEFVLKNGLVLVERL